MDENNNYDSTIDETNKLPKELNEDLPVERDGVASEERYVPPIPDTPPYGYGVPPVGYNAPRAPEMEYAPERPVYSTPGYTAPEPVRPVSPEPAEMGRGFYYETKDISEFPPDVAFPNTPAREYYKETVRDERSKSKKSRFKMIAALVIVSTICGGLAIGGGFAAVSALFFKENTPEAKVAQQEFRFEETNSVEPEKVILPVQEGYADLIEAIEPSIVCIYSKGQIESYFSYSYEGVSSGSGIIFSEDSEKCYIATNAHVISGMDEVSVSISQADPVSAKLVGKNMEADLAVISVQKEDLNKVGINKVTIAGFGNSDNMRVGDIVLSIGNALGKGNTATNGILSAKDKEITTDGAPSPFMVIQTNAAINPGNSGGPLINTRGEVIGVTIAKAFDSKVEGMGYAIPSNIAKPILEDLMNTKLKPRLGVSVSTLDQAYASQMNLLAAGALVQSVVEGSPADIAGIRQFDVITGVDGNPVFTSEDLVSILAEKQIGDTVEVKLVRGKEYVTVNVKLASVEDQNF